MDICFDKLLQLVLKGRIEEIKKLLEQYSRRRVGETLLTLEETVILLMFNVLGYRVDEIAKILGVSRSSVYAALKRAKLKSEIAEKTINFYNGLTNAIRISVNKGNDLRNVIEKIFHEADRLGLKLPFRSIEIAEELRRLGVADKDYVVEDSLIIVIPRIGIFRVEKVSE